MTAWVELNRAANSNAFAIAARQPPQLLAALRREIEKAIVTGASAADLRRHLGVVARELAS